MLTVEDVKSLIKEEEIRVGGLTANCKSYIPGAVRIGDSFYVETSDGLVEITVWEDDGYPYVLAESVEALPEERIDSIQKYLQSLRGSIDLVERMIQNTKNKNNRLND